MRFYDEKWKLLREKYPLVADKIEELRCETVSSEEYEEVLDLVEKLLKRVEKLEQTVGLGGDVDA